MELREVLAALRERWLWPVGGILLGGVAALALVVLQKPLYTSSTQLFVSTTDTTSTSDAFQGSQFSEQRVTSYAQLIAGKEMADRVIARLGLSRTSEQVQKQINVTAVPNTVLIDVTVTDHSPALAQQMAEALDSEFIALVGELERPTSAAGTSPVKVTVTDQPDLPTAPSSPKRMLDVTVGLLAGLLLGSALVVARRRLDRTVKDADEAAQLAGAPIVGTVLRDVGLQKQHTIDGGAAGRAAEDYRQLRNNLQFLDVDNPPQVIMVSSALPSEGKTTLVINLALALADAGRQVAIVEADLRRPKVIRYLEMVAGVGVTNVLAGTVGMEDVMQSYRAKISVLGSGPTPPNPGELLGSTHMTDLVDKLRAQNDVVLIDVPPVLPVADATSLAPSVDAVLLSVRYGGTRKEQLRQAAAAFERVSANVCGVVLNMVPAKGSMGSAYAYDYSYEDEQKQSRR